jgi:hypothetical protein
MSAKESDTAGHAGTLPRNGQVALAASATWPLEALHPARTRHTIPAMVSDEGTWFELQTDSHAAGPAERYRDKAAAERAATVLLIRQPGLQFVDVAEYEIRDGESSEPSVVNRITASHPPAPEEAAVDDLHRLPRGDPEC